MIQAVIGGSIDIATAVGTSAAIGTFAKRATLRLIGSEMIGAAELYWYVRADFAVRTIADLNGKTIAYSLTSSSSHAAVLALIQQYKLSAKPVSTGSIQATVTQTMTGQVDVGFGAAPFGLDVVEDGKARIVATGDDLAALRTRSVRVNVTNAAALAGRRDAISRFVQAYRETLDWMYADPAALRDLQGLFRPARRHRAAGARPDPQGGHEPRPCRRNGSDHCRSGQSEIHRGATERRANEGVRPDSPADEVTP